MDAYIQNKTQFSSHYIMPHQQNIILSEDDKI
jgi:hypothetical protein